MDMFDQLPETERIARYERFARKALKPYGLEEADLRFLGQSANVMFRVQTDTGRWALRICNPGRDHKILRRELLWLVALSRDTDLEVPEPVIMRSGELFHSVSMPGLSGFRACMLFRWVKGQFADTLTAAQGHAMGTLSAKLHKHAETFRWPEELAPTHSELETVGGNVPLDKLKMHYSVADAQLLRDTIPLIQQAMEILGTGSDVRGVIHGDLHPRNIPFHEGVAGAIDFECVQQNYYIYDIATTLGPLRGRPDFDELKGTYVDGYTAIRPLPSDLEIHIPAFDVMRMLHLIAWILDTPRLRTEEWARGILDTALLKSKRLLELE